MKKWNPIGWSWLPKSQQSISVKTQKKKSHSTHLHPGVLTDMFWQRHILREATAPRQRGGRWKAERKHGWQGRVLPFQQQGSLLGVWRAAQLPDLSTSVVLSGGWFCITPPTPLAMGPGSIRRHSKLSQPGRKVLLASSRSRQGCCWTCYSAQEPPSPSYVTPNVI